MAKPVRRSIDLTGFPDLVVVYHRAHSLRGMRSLARIGRELAQVQREQPDGLLLHKYLLFGWLSLGFRQYWRDLESLEAFTRATRHAAWWRDFGTEVGGGGVWHETYRPRDGMEAIYLDMPPTGLARFAPERAPVGSFLSARQRVAAMTPPPVICESRAGVGSWDGPVERPSNAPLSSTRTYRDR